ncbi:MAG: biotin synthase BioB [Planctomycetia bacterium]
MLTDVDLLALSQRVVQGGSVSRDEAREMMLLDGPIVYDLMYAANKIRRRFIGDKVSFCSIVPAKFGNCSEDCKFCTQSVYYDTGAAPHAMMEPEEVGKAARDAKANGASAFGIVNQGKGPSKHDWHKVLGAVEEIHKIDGLCHCAALGELNDEQAADLKNAGLRRYNHNLETSREHYPNVVTTHTWEDRYRTALTVRKAGLELCSGVLLGMGETVDDRVSVLFSLRELNPNVVPMNFLHPRPGTPFEHLKPMQPLEILKCISVFRFVLPTQDIKVAGGRELNLRDLQSWMFYAGASSGLVGNYLSTFGRPAEEDLQMIRDLGLRWDEQPGDANPDLPIPTTPPEHLRRPANPLAVLNGV